MIIEIDLGVQTFTLFQSFFLIFVSIISRCLQHPNILCLLGVINAESSVIIVTNYVEGNDLQTMIFDHNIDRVCDNTNYTVTMLTILYHCCNGLYIIFSNR